MLLRHRLIGDPKDHLEDRLGTTNRSQEFQGIDLPGCQIRNQGTCEESHLLKKGITLITKEWRETKETREGLGVEDAMMATGTIPIEMIIEEGLREILLPVGPGIKTLRIEMRGTLMMIKVGTLQASNLVNEVAPTKISTEKRTQVWSLLERMIEDQRTALMNRQQSRIYTRGVFTIKDEL